MDSNKLIAEFMGYKFYNNLPQQRNGYQLPKNKGTAIYLAYSTSDLQYHTSWDWLMPVVDKIENLGYWVNRNDGDVTISNKSDIIVITPMSSGGIDMMYKAVVEFIKQYNKNR